MVEAPIDRRREPLLGKVGAQVFVGFFRRTASKPQELLAFPSSLSPISLADVPADRLRRLPQLDFVKQTPRTPIEKAIRFVSDKPCRLDESWLWSHDLKLRSDVATGVTGKPRPGALACVVSPIRLLGR